MPTLMPEIAEMEAENKQVQKSDEAQAVQSEEVVENTDSTEEFSNELDQPCWSVVTFEGVAIGGLRYGEAQKWLEKLHQQRISGLCIVTDEAAARLSK